MDEERVSDFDALGVFDEDALAEEERDAEMVGEAEPRGVAVGESVKASDDMGSAELEQDAEELWLGHEDAVVEAETVKMLGLAEGEFDAETLPNGERVAEGLFDCVRDTLVLAVTDAVCDAVMEPVAEMEEVRDARALTESARDMVAFGEELPVGVCEATSLREGDGLWEGDMVEDCEAEALKVGAKEDDRVTDTVDDPLALGDAAALAEAESEAVSVAEAEKVAMEAVAAAVGGKSGVFEPLELNDAESDDRRDALALGEGLTLMDGEPRGLTVRVPAAEGLPDEEIVAEVEAAALADALVDARGDAVEVTV